MFFIHVVQSNFEFANLNKARYLFIICFKRIEETITNYPLHYIEAIFKLFLVQLQLFFSSLYCIIIIFIYDQRNMGLYLY